MKHMIVVGDAEEGVLFTNCGVDPAGADAAMARRTSICFAGQQPSRGEHNLAKPNFGYQKRQKELEKKRKKEEKMKRKLEKNAAPAADAPPPAAEPGEAA